MANPVHRDGLKRYGINTVSALGITTPKLRKLAKSIGRDQKLAEALWESPIHECKMLGSLIADPDAISARTCERWTSQFYSWDICDVTSILFARTSFGKEMALKWTTSDKEYVKRAGFATLVSFTIHSKEVSDEEILELLPVIEREAWDHRNFVKKAVNWLLRQIGKRNPILNREAIFCAERLLNSPDKSAKWIARDALRELRSESVRDRLAKKNKSG